jgi:hypothetical protein
MFFVLCSTKSDNMRAEQVHPGGRAGTSGRGEVWRKGIGGRIQCKKCVQVLVNAKMIPVETTPGMG